MDKNAIKKYAVWARRELIEKVALRAGLYGITEKDHGNPNAETFNGHLLSQAERRQRNALIQRIEARGYRQVIEEVAYTWFNRFAAIRFMEVNGYLPSFVRVFSDENGAFKPQIVTEAIHLQLPGLDMAKVYEMKNENDNEGLFKYLFIVQCNALNDILPGMFQKIEDYTELLLPDYLLRDGSVIEQMVTTIPEDDWKDQVQIIGWLYQYYNTEPKDKVFADLKKNIKISKETIPAATQLFTPDWIVHYMVENSLGRLWVEGHPSAAEKYLPAHNEDGSVRVEPGKWNYYLEEAEQEAEVQAQLAEIRKQYASLKPEEILVIDPCAGSGHILCVLFDVLVDIYKDYGYSEREAAASIVKNNLWGLDIDDRAAQLAYFAVMMKARQYDRRFFARSEKVQPHVFAIQETNMLGGSYKYVMGDFLLSKEHTYYRQFHRCYSDALRAYHDELSDRFTPVKDTVEGLYKNWFLGQLGANWSDACSESLREKGRIPEIPRQQDFYRSKVVPADSRIYVIISDGLRYEVAASLAEQLRWESQAEVQLSSMQGIFPSVTKYGMAALLPHKKLSVELRTGKTDRLGVLADGQSTEAPNRDKVLKSADIHSVALQYNKIITMKRADRQDLVRGMNVVYIYHDVIDSAGHQETNVFSACDTTIEELKNIVRIIANEWGGANILITSDHGFLYTFSPLTEDDKVDKTTESAQDVEVDRRYLITEKGASPQYLLPVKFLGGDTPYDAFAARENVRIKKKGGGSNYVHGGISLQEMVIPLIEYHFLRNQNSEYKKNRSKYDTKPVEIALLSANRKITNMIFSLNFYQKEPLSYNREKATYQLYFVDSAGKTVSDTALIIADKISENAQERIFRCSFNLKSQKYSSTESYYLRIADENGMVVGQEEFQIDIAFAVDDFDFFG